jgi:hypothetical protein
MVLIDRASVRVAYLIQQGVQGIATSPGPLMRN